MTDEKLAVQTASTSVLGIETGGTPAFVLRQIGERRFSRTMAELNRDYLTGTPEQRRLARRALLRLGFPEV